MLSPLTVIHQGCHSGARSCASPESITPMLSVSFPPVVMDSGLAGKSPRPGMTRQEFCRLVSLRLRCELFEVRHCSFLAKVELTTPPSPPPGSGDPQAAGRTGVRGRAAAQSG